MRAGPALLPAIHEEFMAIQAYMQPCLDSLLLASCFLPADNIFSTFYDMRVTLDIQGN